MPRFSRHCLLLRRHCKSSFGADIGRIIITTKTFHFKRYCFRNDASIISSRIETVTENHRIRGGRKLTNTSIPILYIYIKDENCRMCDCDMYIYTHIISTCRIAFRQIRMRVKASRQNGRGIQFSSIIRRKLLDSQRRSNLSVAVEEARARETLPRLTMISHTSEANCACVTRE